MGKRKNLAAGAALAGLLAAPAALAEVTADQVWADLQNTAAGSGQTITGQAERSGDTLVVSPVNFSMQTETGEVTGRIDELRLAERGDGTVAIDASDAYPVEIAMNPPEGEPVEMQLSVRQPDLQVVASGDANDLSYAIDAPEIAVTLEEMTMAGEPVDYDFILRLAEVDGTYSLKAGTPRRIESDLAAATLSMALDIPDTEEGPAIEAEATVENVESTGTSRLTGDGEGADLGAMLEAGFETEAEMSYGPARYSFTSWENGATTSVEGSADNGTFDLDMGGDTLTYHTTGTGAQATLRAPWLPLPSASFAMDESEYELEMPVTATDRARDFSLLLRLTGLTLDEAVWSVLDPSGTLPHEPAKLVLDMSGQGRWATDILSPDAAAQTEGAPGELRSLNLDSLDLALAGVELTGEGAFEFAEDATGAGGVPAASGTAEFRATGINGLLDDLVEMDVIPQERASGARMMMGLFARPGEGEDTLVSKIEITEDGEIRANGQRLR